VFKSPPFRCAEGYDRTNPICRDGTMVDREELEQLRKPAMDALDKLATTIPDVSFHSLPDGPQLQRVPGGPAAVFRRRSHKRIRQSASLSIFHGARISSCANGVKRIGGCDANPRRAPGAELYRGGGFVPGLGWEFLLERGADLQDFVAHRRVKPMCVYLAQ